MITDVYRKGMFRPEEERIFETIEKALGYELFVWQKTYIISGNFRQYGATTAIILRELLNINEPPIDHTIRCKNESERLYREELKKMKEILENEGIQTRTVFFSNEDKREYANQKSKEEKHV